MELEKISERQQTPEAYHLILQAVDCFQRMTVNCPTVVQKVIANAYERFDSALFWTYKCANRTEASEKHSCLTNAREDLFFQFNTIHLLIRARSLTIGQANEVISAIKIAYEQLGRWDKSCVKQISSECICR